MFTTIIVAIAILFLTFAILRMLEEKGEADYQRAKLGGRQGVERYLR